MFYVFVNLTLILQTRAQILLHVASGDIDTEIDTFKKLRFRNMVVIELVKKIW